MGDEHHGEVQLGAQLEEEIQDREARHGKRLESIQGRISEEDFWRIWAAHQRGETPPSDTPLGGALGFHGEGERWRGDSADLDWTFGCVAMTDAEIDFLAERLEPGTPVEILP